MSKFGTLITGNGVATIVNLPFVPQFLLVGTVDTDLPIEGLSVSIEGVDKISIVDNQSLLQAYAKWSMEGMLGADVKIGQLLKIADGKISGKDCQITITNAGVSTPDIYAYSDRKGANGLNFGTSTIQSSSNKVYNQFGALFFPTANVDYAQVTWKNGHSDKLTVPELRSLFVQTNQTDADGQLAGITVIDNLAAADARGLIDSVDLYTTNGGTCTVGIVR